MAIVHSLSSVSVVITNDVLGTIQIGGGGKQVDTVSYNFDTDMFSKQATADGGVIFSHNAARDGTISITLKQTSPHIGDLTRFYEDARINPYSAGSTITIKDGIGTINVVARDCLPTRLPQNSVSDTPSDREFGFICGQINPQEFNVN